MPVLTYFKSLTFVPVSSYAAQAYKLYNQLAVYDAQTGFDRYGNAEKILDLKDEEFDSPPEAGVVKYIHLTHSQLKPLEASFVSIENNQPEYTFTDLSDLFVKLIDFKKNNPEVNYDFLSSENLEFQGCADIYVRIDDYLGPTEHQALKAAAELRSRDIRDIDYVDIRKQLLPAAKSLVRRAASRDVIQQLEGDQSIFNMLLKKFPKQEDEITQIQLQWQNGRHFATVSSEMLFQLVGQLNQIDNYIYHARKELQDDGYRESNKALHEWISLAEKHIAVEKQKLAMAMLSRIMLISKDRLLEILCSEDLDSIKESFSDDLIYTTLNALRPWLKANCVDGWLGKIPERKSLTAKLIRKFIDFVVLQGDPSLKQALLNYLEVDNVPLSQSNHAYRITNSQATNSVFNSAIEIQQSVVDAPEKQGLSSSLNSDFAEINQSALSVSHFIPVPSNNVFEDYVRSIDLSESVLSELQFNELVLTIKNVFRDASNQEMLDKLREWIDFFNSAIPQIEIQSKRYLISGTPQEFIKKFIDGRILDLNVGAAKNIDVSQVFLKSVLKEEAISFAHVYVDSYTNRFNLNDKQKEELGNGILSEFIERAEEKIKANLEWKKDFNHYFSEVKPIKRFLEVKYDYQEFLLKEISRIKNGRFTLFINQSRTHDKLAELNLALTKVVNADSLDELSELTRHMIENKKLTQKRNSIGLFSSKFKSHLADFVEKQGYQPKG